MKRKAQHLPVFMRPTGDQVSIPEPNGHPCPAQETIERLCAQVTLLEQKAAYLQMLLFKLIAAQISGGDLASRVWAWLDCDQCRVELACLVEKAAEQKVH